MTQPDALAMEAPRAHCPHCGRGSNFRLPKIVINWDRINREQYNTSRRALLAKLERMTEGKEGAYWSDNWFTRSELHLISALIIAGGTEPASEEQER